MKERLTKERRRLFRRIILIMLGIWLVVSAVFCVVRLNTEISKVKNNAFTSLDKITKILTDRTGSEDSINSALTDTINAFYSMDNYLDRQLTITDSTSGELYLDTAYATALKFRIQISEIKAEDITAVINYWDIRDALSAEDLDEIKTTLNTKRDDGNYYELICTKLQRIKAMTIPVELTLVLVDGKDNSSLINNNVKTYSLDRNRDDNYTEYDSSDVILNNTVIRNVIPKDFLFEGKYAKQLIATLSPEQRKNINAIAAVHFKQLQFGDNSWFIEYAQKANVFENFRNDLLFALPILLAFLLLIAVFPYLIAWRTIKTQLIKEQQRIDLTNTLVHDAKTPLFVISGYAQCLKEDIDQSERELYIEKIMEQADTANSLVCRMLNFSKLDSYQLTLHKSTFDLHAQAEDVLQNYTVLPGNKKIVLTHSGNNTVTADKGLIKTALQNLTDNAVKYALPDTEIHIDITNTSCAVSNQAEPLTKEELKELQMPYVHKERGNRQKGSGLGLSIVKSILELHGSSLTIGMKGDVFMCSFKL